MRTFRFSGSMLTSFGERKPSSDSESGQDLEERADSYQVGPMPHRFFDVSNDVGDLPDRPESAAHSVTSS